MLYESALELRRVGEDVDNDVPVAEGADHMRVEGESSSDMRKAQRG